MEAECLRFSSIGDIMLLGDFNARIGSLQEVITDDEVPLRISRDTVVISYGHALLDLCVGHGLRIANGRLGSDHDLGEFTCITARGQSVVDYCVAPFSVFGRIMNFTVNMLKPESDNCPISFTLQAVYISVLPKVQEKHAIHRQRYRIAGFFRG